MKDQIVGFAARVLLPRAKTLADVVANWVKTHVEEQSSPEAVVLPGFRRSLQLDRYSCGAQSVFSVLHYFGKARSVEAVKKGAGTTTEGTSSRQLIAFIKRRGLRPVIIRSPTVTKIKREISAGHPVIVYVDGDHWAVAYGHEPGFVFIADSALNRAVLCKHSTARFRARWDGWAMAVRRR